MNVAKSKGRAEFPGHTGQAVEQIREGGRELALRRGHSELKRFFVLQPDIILKLSEAAELEAPEMIVVPVCQKNLIDLFDPFSEELSARLGDASMSSVPPFAATSRRFGCGQEPGHCRLHGRRSSRKRRTDRGLSLLRIVIPDSSFAFLLCFAGCLSVMGL